MYCVTTRVLFQNHFQSITESLPNQFLLSKVGSIHYLQTIFLNPLRVSWVWFFFPVRSTPIFTVHRWKRSKRRLTNYRGEETGIIKRNVWGLRIRGYCNRMLWPRFCYTSFIRRAVGVWGRNRVFWPVKGTKFS